MGTTGMPYSRETGLTDSGAQLALTRRDILPADLESVRREVRQISRRYGLDVERADQLALAVSEVATNAIKHAAGCTEIVMTYDAVASRLVVTVHDRGPGLPLWVAAHPDAEAIHGRGLYLVHVICDEVMVKTGPTGTVMSLVMVTSPDDT
jgi:anti-sigma regulatory factor (Ser/Thr protein kinase)